MTETLKDSQNPSSADIDALIFIAIETGVEPELFKPLETVESNGIFYHSFRLDYPTIPETGQTLADILVADVDTMGGILGYGQISFEGDTKVKLKDKPYVGYIETNIGLRNQGIGMHRMIIMNNLSLKYFGFPLHSDPVGNTSREAYSCWRKLVAQGKAERFIDEDILRYRFVTS